MSAVSGVFINSRLIPGSRWYRKDWQNVWITVWSTAINLEVVSHRGFVFCSLSKDHKHIDNN